MRRSLCASRLLPWIGGVLVLASLGACSDDDGGDAGLLPADLDAGEMLECPADQPPFRTGPDGLSVTDTAAGIKARVEDADYIPPNFGFNSWKIAITDPNDAPLAAAQLTWACAYMPKHGHGALPRTVKFENGMVELGRMNMRMTGPWEVQLWVNTTGAGEDFKGGSNTGIHMDACNAPDRTIANLILSTCVPSL